MRTIKFHANGAVREGRVIVSGHSGYIVRCEGELFDRTVDRKDVIRPKPTGRRARSRRGFTGNPQRSKGSGHGS